MSINSNLKNFRMNCGMTQEEVAEKMNVTRQAISGYETGRTRPDLETITKFAELYHTDLEGIIYGTDKAIQARKRVFVTSVVLFILVTLLTFLGSSFTLYANRVLPIKDGTLLSDIGASYWEAHVSLVQTGELFSSLAPASALIGFLILLWLLTQRQNGISIKQKFAYLGAFTAALLLASVPFALCDPVFGWMNYMLAPMRIVTYGIIFLCIGCFIELIRKRRKQ